MSQFAKIATLAMLAGCIAVGAVSAQDQIQMLQPGVKAPNFTARTVQGKKISLASLRGKVVLVDFWATWCGPCRMASPTLQSLYEKYGKKGFAVVGMSLDDSSTRDQIQPFAKEAHLTYTLTSGDGNASVGRKYQVSGIPAQYLIDKKGVIRWSQDGYSPDEKTELDAKIKALLAQK